MNFLTSRKPCQGSYRAALRANRIRKRAAARSWPFITVPDDYVEDPSASAFSARGSLQPCFINLTRKIVNQLAMVYV
jgi:hypothetical protein